MVRSKAPHGDAALPRIDVLVLSSLARTPMHGYELKLELRYKHVRWWAKCEHGHLYAALKRLEARGLIEGEDRANGKRSRRVFTITTAGLEALEEALGQLARSADQTYFDIDLFIAAAFVLDRGVAVELLGERIARIEDQCARATALREQMGPYVPAAGKLIMDHRIEHLGREVVFARRVADALRLEAAWGPHLGTESIKDYVKRTGVRLEDNGEGD